MRKGPICLAVAAALTWSMLSGEADAQQKEVFVYGLGVDASLGEEEADTLLSVVSMGLEELPRADFSVKTVKRDESGSTEACDVQCTRDHADESGADYAVICELKVLKKRQLVLTVTLSDTADGQVLHSSVSDVCPDLNGLMTAARDATDAMKAILVSTTPPPPEPTSPVEPPSAPPESSGPLPGILRISSAPPGAQVVLKNSKKDPGQNVGTTPVELSLKPWTYWVQVSMAGYLEYEERVGLGSDQALEMDVTLEVDKWPPLRIAAHATLWPGLVLGLLGGASGYMSWKRGNEYDEELDTRVADKSRQWAGVMYASGGLSAALVTAGIVFFALRSKEKKSAAGKGQISLGASPLPDAEGGVLALQGRF